MELGTELKGWVTERHFQEAEAEFPGIEAFFRGLGPEEKPGTFLELVWKYEERMVH
jgi:hypothetical protein